MRSTVICEAFVAWLNMKLRVVAVMLGSELQFSADSDATEKHCDCDLW